MKRNGVRVISEQDREAISSSKHKEDPFYHASQALRKALIAVSALELTKPMRPLELEASIDFYAEVSGFEVSLIRYALIKAGGKQKHAASLLGLKVTTLNAKIKAYRIDCKETS